MGLYVPSFERGHATHALTQKIRRSKYSREHDLEFAELLAGVAMGAFPRFKPDLVVSVPESSRHEDRFRTIRSEVARRVGVTTADATVRQTRVLGGYRQMTRAQRTASAAGCFVANGLVRGRSVLLIDDVLTSGSQAREAVCALIAGALDWRFAAIAKATAAPGDRRTCPT